MNGIAESLSGLLGKESVSEDQEVTAKYSQDLSFNHPLKPRGVVKVKSAQDIQKLVQWANETNTPLVPVSSGPPHFRGDTVPGVPGAVIVDLTGMKKIVHVDPRNRMVIVEPGVTYGELQPELAKSGLRLSSSIMPRANKSVISNLLEREPIMVSRYQWNMLDPLRCLEVVWGDGQKMTTGEACSAGTLEEEWARKFAQVAPAGPGQANFYKFASAAQGTMGIVSWASLKCEVLPQIHNMYFVASQKLENLINLAYSVLRIRFGDELFILNNWNLATMLGKNPDRIEALAAQLPLWMLIIGIAGRDTLPEEKVAYQEKDISEMAQKEGLQLLPAVPGASGDDVLQAALNPSSDPYWKLRYKGGCQEIFFITTLEKVPEFMKTMYSVTESVGYPTSEIGMYIQPIHQGASCHCEFDLAFDRNNVKEVEMMKKLYVKASEELLQQGAYYSRPYGIWADMAFNRDAQTTTVLKKIKGIFDPNNIMNPGKLCF